MSEKLILTATKFARKFKPFNVPTLGFMRANAEKYNVQNAFVKEPFAKSPHGFRYLIDVEKFALGFLNLASHKHIKDQDAKIHCLTEFLDQKTNPKKPKVILRKNTERAEVAATNSIREAVLRALDIRVTVNGKEIQL